MVSQFDGSLETWRVVLVSTLVLFVTMFAVAAGIGGGDGTRAELSTSARERPQLPTSLRTLSTGPAAPPVQLVWPHSVVVRRESVVLHVHAETVDSQPA